VNVTVSLVVEVAVMVATVLSPDAAVVNVTPLENVAE